MTFQMMTITNLISLFVLHFIGDFLLQSDKMAINKSSSMRWLAVHSFVYSLPLLYFGVSFALMSGMMHFIVDGITSKVTSRLWKEEKRHWFFVTIGADQMIHMIMLIITLGAAY